MILSCHQVIAQRIRWSQGLQTATSRTAHGAGASYEDVTLSDLLEYHCPKSGLTPLMAAVVKGHLAVARQVDFTSSHPAWVRSMASACSAAQLQLGDTSAAANALQCLFSVLSHRARIHSNYPGPLESALANVSPLKQTPNVMAHHQCIQAMQATLLLMCHLSDKPPMSWYTTNAHKPCKQCFHVSATLVKVAGVVIILWPAASGVWGGCGCCRFPEG